MRVRINPLFIILLCALLLLGVFSSGNILAGKLSGGCGNNVVEAGEVCDGRAFKYTCEELGYSGDCTLTCSACSTIEVK